MASVHMDDGESGLCNNFEATTAHLLPYDPVAKKRTLSNKHPAAQILAISVEDVDIAMLTGAIKASTGKTGVHLQYHTSSEYRELTMEQKKKLSEWHASNPDKKNNATKQIRRSTPPRSNSLWFWPRKCRRCWPPQ